MRSTTLKTVAHSHFTSERKKFVLTSISIGAAAFFLAAVFILSQSLTASFRATAEPAYSHADYVINALGNNLLRNAVDGADGEVTLTNDQVKAIRDSQDVEVVGSRGMTYLDAKAGSASAVVEMESLPDKTEDFPYAYKGTLPTNDRQVAISSLKAQDLGLKVGDQVSLDATNKAETSLAGKPLTISAIFNVDSNLSMDSMTFYFVPALVDTEAPKMSGAADGLSTYEEISVKLKDPSQGFPSQLEVALNSGEASSHPVITPATTQVDYYVKALSQGTDILTYILLAFAGIALLVSTFVIADTFRVLTTLRVAELAMLRTLGAHRRQLTTMLLREAFSLGFVSSAVGVALAYVVGLVLQALTPANIVVGLSPVAGIIGIAVGTVVTVLGSLLPAMGAMKVSPLAALSNAQTVEADPAVSRKTLVAGSVLVLAGAALFAYAHAHHESFLVLIATFVFAVGVLLVFPLILWLILRALQGLVRGSGIATLALNQAVHSMRRTASTGTIVFLSTMLIAAVLTGYSTGSASNAKLSETSYPVALQAPVFEQESSEGKLVPWQDVEQKENELRSLEHVTGASIAVPAGKITEGMAEIPPSGGPTVYAVDAQSIKQTLPRLEENLDENVLLLPSSFAPENDGKKVVITAGDSRVEVTARVSDLNFYMPIISHKTAEPLMAAYASVKEGYAAMVNADSSLSSTEAKTLTDDVARVTASDQSKIYGGLTERLRNEQIMFIIVAMVLGLLSIATLIALIGIANTLSLSAYQRRRENAMLRSIGMSAKKLSSLVALESLIVAAVAVICGVAVGIGLAIMGVQTLAVDGIEMVYSASPFALLVLVIFAIGLAYVASLLPARKASKVSPVEALRVS